MNDPTPDPNGFPMTYCPVCERYVSDPAAHDEKLCDHNQPSPTTQPTKAET